MTWSYLDIRKATWHLVEEGLVLLEAGRLVRRQMQQCSWGRLRVWIWEGWWGCLGEWDRDLRGSIIGWVCMWCGEESSRILGCLAGQLNGWLCLFWDVTFHTESEWLLDEYSLGNAVFSMLVGRCLIGSSLFSQEVYVLPMEIGST